MCSIVGYSGCFNRNLIEKIMFNSRIRGLHAFGYSFFKKKIVNKKFHNYDEFLTQLILDSPTKFIAHFRYSTSGNFLNHKNNQPILLNATALVFNGIIDMGLKSEMESKYRLKLKTCNDGEIVLNAFQGGKNRVKNIIKTKTFAGLFLTEKNIYIIRNNSRPCYMGEFDGVNLVASTKDILKRSGVINIQKTEPLKYYQI